MSNDQTLHLTVSRHIAAPPDAVYDLISDVTAIGRYSPETTGARWLGDDTAARVGARFAGRNAIGRMRWTTKPVVTVAEPGRRFAFRVPSGALSTWTYDLQASGEGTTVTESVRTEKAQPMIIRVLMRMAGVTDRAAVLHAGMSATLDRLAAAAVQPAPAAY